MSIFSIVGDIAGKVLNPVRDIIDEVNTSEEEKLQLRAAMEGRGFITMALLMSGVLKTASFRVRPISAKWSKKPVITGTSAKTGTNSKAGWSRVSPTTNP